MDKENIIAQSVIIPNRLWFELVESGGYYSVYHHLDGGYGQRVFNNESEARRHLQNQEDKRKFYIDTIGKRDAIRRRILPLRNKEQMLNWQLDALILSR